MKDGDKIIDKLLGKRNRKILVDCVRIFELFDPPIPEGIPEYPLSGFLSETTKLGEIIELIKKEKDEIVLEDFELRLQEISSRISFGFGFVLGQMFDLTAAKTNVESLKEVLKAESILPYLPREKKAA